MGEWTYTWQHGRQLASMARSGEVWNYTYCHDGLRTKRTNGSITYEYVYSDNQLVKMTRNGTSYYINYDSFGKPLAIEYASDAYYYLVNIQGDVIGLTDERGQVVVEYCYDAWGRILSVTGSMASTLGQYNPLRYRSYVYDTETGLYYLQSRYYNPEIGRFINADAYASTGQGVLGNNMFAYCNNNPVMGHDPTGHFSWKNLFYVAAAVTITALAVAVIVASGGTAAPPLLAAASTVAGSAVTSAAVVSTAVEVSVVGIGIMSAALTAQILEASQNNQYNGRSTYNKNGNRIDYEYNGNGTGNVHYHGPKGKEMIWRLKDGIETYETVSKSVSKIIGTPAIQKAIVWAIDAVKSLAGIE